MDLLDLTVKNETLDISNTDLNNFWNEVIAGDNTNISISDGRRVLETAFLNQVGYQETSNEEESGDIPPIGFFTIKRASELDFIRKGWKINLKDGLVKTALASATMAGLLTVVGISGGLAAAIIPTVMPYFFELESVSLSKKENLILGKLLLKDEVKIKLHSGKELYELLPDEIKDDINFMDFQDFLETLELSGHNDTYTKEYRISEKTKFKLTIV
jgi:hypothetical protein